MAPVLDTAQSPGSLAKKWLGLIASAEKDREKWLQRGRKIIKRYRSESGAVGDGDEASTEFNLFWSNVETLGPATYSRRPRVEVSRRFRDADPVGRLAGRILERALQYEVDQSLNLHHALQLVVKDRLMPGLGAVWVRYEPAFQQETVEKPVEGQLETVQETVETLSDEKSPVDYVFWEDFLVSPARNWSDVRWVARRLYFAKDHAAKRFTDSCKRLGGDLSTLPYNYDPAKLEPETTRSPEGGGDASDTCRAAVWELWDKDSGQLLWLAPGFETPLDVQADVAELEGFFPCPPPLTATTSTDKFLPVPDYILYQKQLVELDQVSKRIRVLTKSLRLIGVYDATQDALKDLLTRGGDTTMVPVNAWAAFAEKGGLKSSVDFLPIDMVAKVLEQLYKARDTLKQVIYEITGMSDIIRGSSLASETLGAQQLKAKFANLRLSSRQQQVAEFVTGILQLKAEFICSRYAPETIVRISSAQELDEAKAHPEMLTAALELLKNEKYRNYRIEVAADSMVELDQADERQRRTEFMEAVSNFMNAVKNVASFHPAMLPVSLEMLKFVVRGFSVGRSLEGAIEDAQTQIEEERKNPKPPAPDPKIVADKELEDMRQKGQTERITIQTDAQKAIADARLRAASQEQGQEHRHNQLMEAQNRNHDAARADFEAIQAQQQTAQSAQADQFSQLRKEQQSASEGANTAQIGQIKQLTDAMQILLQKLEDVAKSQGKLRRRVPVYDGAGEIQHVEEQFIN